MAINQRKAGIILSYLMIGLNAVIGFLYVPLLLHYMTQSEYGLYQLMGSIIAYFLVMDFGLSNTIIRFYSKYKAVGDKENMENVLALSSIIYSVIAVLIVIIGLILYCNIGTIFQKSLQPGEMESARRIFLLIIINMAVTVPSKIFEAVITAQERFVFLKLVTILQVMLQPFVVVAVISQHPTAFGVVAVQTVISFLTIFLKAGYCLFALKIKVKLHSFDKYLFFSMVRFAFFIFLGAVVDQLFWRSSQFLLGIVASTVAVSIYGTATTIFNNYMSLSTAVNGVFLPKVTEMVARNAPTSALSEIFIRVGRLQFLLLSCVLSGFILFGQQFIKIWAKGDFGDVYPIALCLIIPFTIDLIQNMGLTIMQAQNKYTFRSVSFLILAIVNVLACIPAALKWGGIGCAVCTGIAYLIGNAGLMNYYYGRRMHLDIKTFWKQIARITPVVGISMVLGALLNLISFGPSLVNLALKIVLYLGIYCAMMWFFAMNAYEKGLVEGILKKITGVLHHGKTASP